MDARAPSIKAAIVAVVVAVPTLYSIWYIRSLAQSVTSTTLPLSATAVSGHPLPEEVKAHPEDWIVCQEHTTKSVPTASLPVVTDLVAAYSRHTMRAFTKLPQASIMYFMIKDSHLRSTFGGKYLAACSFDVGDVVCGVYKVARHDDNEIQLDLHAPPGWKGPAVRGNIVSAIHTDADGNTVFSNDVYMWRKPSEPKMMLESAGGRFFHFLTAAWVVDAGTQGLVTHLS